MNLPKQTAEIFKILSKGRFISANSTQKQLRDLYRIIDDEDNFERLFNYFQNIRFELERGDDYFYFSRKENKVDLENKIRASYQWIDIVDFFKTYDPAFTSGYRFSPSEMLVRIKTDADLEVKLEDLKKHISKEKHGEILEKILKRLVKESFIELENEINHEYKVLDAFAYLEQLIMSINIPEEAQNEISE